MSGNLNAAINAAKRGWHVFPIIPGQKKPIIPDNLAAATTDEAQIREWWTKWPNANIGVACGKSGLVVLDVDTKDGKKGGNSLFDLLEGDVESPLLNTLNAHSWSGGRHYFFKGECGSSQSKLGPGLDIKGAGGYVVIAPSFVEEDGLAGQYRWADPGEGEKWPIADFPDLFRPKEISKSPVRDVVQIPEGSRNAELTRRAGLYRRIGMSPSAIEAALRVDNVAMCATPLPDKEIATIAKSVGRYEPDPDASGTPVSPPARSLPSMLLLPNGGEVMSDEAFLAHCSLEIAWQVEGFVQCGGLMLLCALPKVGKSELARNMAKAVSMGEPFLGRRTKKGKVLWIGLAEPAQTLRGAIETMGLAGRDISWVTSRPPGTWQTWLASVVEQYRPDFVIVDEIARLALDLENANDYAQVRDVTQPFLDLRAKYGTTFVLLHHHNKTSGTATGSPMWEGAVDCIMGLVRTQDNVRTIETRQRIGEDLEPTVLTRDPNTGAISCSISKAMADQRKVEQRILDALAPGQQMTRQALADLSPQGAYLGRRAVDALLAAGLIEASGSGLKSDPRLYRGAPGVSRTAPGPTLGGTPARFETSPANPLLGGKVVTEVTKGGILPEAPEGPRGNPTQPEAPEGTRATRGILSHDAFRLRTPAEQTQTALSTNGAAQHHAEVLEPDELPW
jgi:hypothetical protein